MRTSGFADSRRGVRSAVGGPDGSVSRDEARVLLSACKISLCLSGGAPKSPGEGKPVSLSMCLLVFVDLSMFRNIISRGALRFLFLLLAISLAFLHSSIW